MKAASLVMKVVSRPPFKSLNVSANNSNSRRFLAAYVGAGRMERNGGESGRMAAKPYTAGRCLWNSGVRFLHEYDRNTMAVVVVTYVAYSNPTLGHQILAAPPIGDPRIVLTLVSKTSCTLSRLSR